MSFRSILHDDRVMAECPKCHVEQEDHDGLGVLHCLECGYCTHAAVSGWLCCLCGRDVSREVSR